MIAKALPHDIIAVEHIGSTAVPGLLAKDIVDVQLGVGSFDCMEDIHEVLSVFQFSYDDLFLHDHMPFEAHDRFDAAWEKRFMKGVYEGCSFNVHIRIYGNENWMYALHFRDYLRENEHARRAYQQVKERLVCADVSRYDYTFIKDPVCDLLFLLFQAQGRHVGQETGH